MNQKVAGGEPSTSDVVHDVLQCAEHPLTFEEIFARVNARRPVTTRDPKGTVRGALKQGAQLVSLGAGRYGYLPHLIDGSLLRLPFTEQKPARFPLIYPDDVRIALFPSCMEIQKRKSKRPARVRLSETEVVELPLEFLGPATWGCSMPDSLRRHLIDKRAAAGDALIIRVVDGEAGTCEAWFESRDSRDNHIVTSRNRELAEAAHLLLAGGRLADAPIWELIVALLARGAYHSDVAPDPLQSVLSADSRFAPAGHYTWLLEERLTPDMLAVIRLRQQHEDQLLDRIRVPDAPGVGRSSTPSVHDIVELLNQQFGGDSPSRSSSRRARRTPRRRTRPLVIYQLKVTLRGSRPPIWRRVQVRSETTLEQLHEILQVSMGWQEGHLHQFVANGVQYGTADSDWGVDVEDESEATLADVASGVGSRFVYEYDFGDGWEHDLLIEKVLEPQPGADYPVCLTGRRACPPEDVGGIWGYADFLRAMRDPSDPEHDDLVEWIGGAFDPEAFDVADVNAALSGLAGGE